MPFHLLLWKCSLLARDSAAPLQSPTFNCLRQFCALSSARPWLGLRLPSPHWMPIGAVAFRLAENTFRLAFFPSFLTRVFKIATSVCIFLRVQTDGRQLYSPIPLSSAGTLTRLREEWRPADASPPFFKGDPADLSPATPPPDMGAGKSGRNGRLSLAAGERLHLLCYRISAAAWKLCTSDLIVLACSRRLIFRVIVPALRR